MTDRELMQQALEALEVLDRVVLGTRRAEETIAALRERLAQPEQEPVAWIYTSKLAGNEKYITRYRTDLSTYQADKVWPLYTTPPAAQCEWVGLTDEKVDDLWYLHGLNRYSFARAIEEALKRKNT